MAGVVLAPAPLVGAGLGEDVAIDMNLSLLWSATMLATVAAASVPGQIAMRFDEDMARALPDTPVETTIPIEVLERLPACACMSTARSLSRAAGFFVTLDAGTVTVPGGPIRAATKHTDVGPQKSACGISRRASTLAKRDPGDRRGRAAQWANLSVVESPYNTIGGVPQIALSPAMRSKREASGTTVWRPLREAA